MKFLPLVEKFEERVVCSHLGMHIPMHAIVNHLHDNHSVKFHTSDTSMPHTDTPSMGGSFIAAMFNDCQFVKRKPPAYSVWATSFISNYSMNGQGSSIPVTVVYGVAQASTNPTVPVGQIIYQTSKTINVGANQTVQFQAGIMIDQTSGYIGTADPMQFALMPNGWYVYSCAVYAGTPGNLGECLASDGTVFYLDRNAPWNP